MDIWQADKLFFFIAFVVPGFICLKTFEVMNPRRERSTTERLIDAVAYSCINYALLLWPIFVFESHGYRNTSPNLTGVFYVFVLFVAPVSWACLFQKLRESKFFQGSMPHPTEKPWDYVFSRGESYWIIVTLKGGRRIGGLYSSKSFTSSSPSIEQIYLEEAWVINSKSGFDRKRVNSKGIMVLSPEIVTVEFFDTEQGVENDRQEEA